MAATVRRQQAPTDGACALANPGMTGEITRKNGNKVLVTIRIEQTVIEQLKSNFFRATLAHQWIWSNFQMRLGIGLQYFVMAGRDLDDEQIDEAGVQPASDIGFYWRF